MKKYLFFTTTCLVALSMTFTSCKKNDEGIYSDNPGIDPDKPSVEEQLSPEESKEKLMNVARNLTGKFNTADQQAAIELADGLYEKYESYSWEGFENFYDHRYDAVFNMPRYVKQVMRGRQSPSAIDHTYTFSFAGESAIWEADESTKTWKNLGKANDNSVILRFKDKNGTQCEAKAWGEGSTNTYAYNWQEEKPTKTYVEPKSTWEYSGDYVDSDGEWYSCYFDKKTGRWYYEKYDYNTGAFEYIEVDEKDVTNKYAYDEDTYTDYRYEEETGRYYYNDWDNPYYIDKEIKAVLPAKTVFTLKQGSTEIIRTEFEQEMVKNNHANFSICAKVVNLKWTSDIKINSTNGSAAFAFYYGNERLLSAAANLPSYKLIDKQDSQSYEDWFKQYEERYDELLKNIGAADALVDILGEVQIVVKMDNFGYAYRDYVKWDDNYRYYTKKGCDKLCDLINSNQKNSLFYNSNVKQAEVRAQTAIDDTWQDYDGTTYTDYRPEGVLYFPIDGTTYAFEQYFNHKPFTDLQYTIEDLANKYIKLSQHLYNEIGEVKF